MLKISVGLRLLAVVFVLAIATATALPNYFTGNWAWQHSPSIAALPALRNLQKTGLAIPQWQSLEHQVVDLAGHRWSAQNLVPQTANSSQTSSITLLLRPQLAASDQPQVDWMDINLAFEWRADSVRSLHFKVDQPTPVQVNARFLRGWNRQETVAMVQWYAWSTGGSPNPARWFWVDQMAQLRDRQRMPWVAVCALIPMSPLGDLEAVRAQAESLGATIQAALMTSVLKDA